MFGDDLQAMWWENVEWSFCPVCHSCSFSYIQPFKIVQTSAAWRCFLWYVGSYVSEEPAASILSIEEDSAVKLEAADFSEALVPRLRTYCTSSLSILGLRLQTPTSVSIVQVAGGRLPLQRWNLCTEWRNEGQLLPSLQASWR